MRGSAKWPPFENPRSSRFTQRMYGEADVHRVHVGGRIADLDGVAEAGRFERLVPPERAGAHRSADRIGNAGIEIEDDRRLRLADRRGRIFFFEPPAADPLHVGCRLVRRGVVLEGDRADADAWIRPPRTVARLGRLHERVVKADGQRARIRRDAADERTGRVGPEGQRGLYLGVAREAFRLREVRTAPGGVQPERPLAAAAQRAFEVGGVADQQRRGIDEQAARRLGFDRQRGDDRSGK